MSKLNELRDHMVCKAKRLDNGNWIIGWLTGAGDRAYLETLGSCHEVDVNTVCRSTGFRDINHTLIFENDILSNQMVPPDTHEKMRYTVYAYRHEWRLNVVMDDCVVVCTSQAMCEVNHSKYKIWGNVIDNPLWYTFTQTANGKPQFISLAQESCSE